MSRPLAAFRYFVVLWQLVSDETWRALAIGGAQ